MKRYINLVFAAVALIAFLTGCDKKDENEISMDVVSKGIVLVQGNDGTTYEAVDLGLMSGKCWAKCNLGATSPEQPGYYLSWADTVLKESFRPDNYAWYDPTGESITKYCPNPEYGYHKYTDSYKKMQPEDDPAKHYLGQKWSTPSYDDYNELRTWCKFRWCKLKGQSGFLITSTIEGYEKNSIFLPIAGVKDFDRILYGTRYGFYWTTDLREGDPTNAYIIRIMHDDGVNDLQANITHERYIGLNVRPVTKRP